MLRGQGVLQCQKSNNIKQSNKCTKKGYCVILKDECLREIILTKILGMITKRRLWSSEREKILSLSATYVLGST